MAEEEDWQPAVATLPRQPPSKDPRSAIYHKYNPLSRLCFCWLDSLFCYGARHTLQHEDLYANPSEADTGYLLEKFVRFWRVEVSRHQRNGRAYLSWALFKCIWWRIMVNGILFGIQTPLLILSTLFLGNITEYLGTDSPSSAERHDAYLNALWLSLTAIGIILTTATAAFIGYKSGMLIRVICTSAIYNKILSLSQGTVSKLTIGHIVNLASNDVHRFDLVFVFINFLWIQPVFLVGIGVVLYYEIGVATTFVAIALLIGQLPLLLLLSKLLSSFRLKAAKVTDERVKVMNEVITGIRVIKMYGWENAFHQLVSNIRHNEMMIILKSSVMRAINLAMFGAALPTMVFIIFSVYVSLGGCITLRKTFITLLILTIARNNSNFVFASAMSNVGEAFVAVKRIQKFLLMEELGTFILDKSNVMNLPSPSPLSKQDESFPFVSVNSISCSWSREEECLSLNNITFTVTKDHPIIAVVGSVGAGKSTLLQCVLGELHPIKGDINMEGTVAYAGQEPWIFSDTMRENILFGQPYYPDWYNTVIDLCTLDKDIDILPDGDLTMIGERGVTLSGGQKARVGLARAVYRKAGIYLLDDPLSAVDAAVSRHIFDRCIKGFLTQSSVVILVTHQLQYVRQCDTVLVLNKGSMAAYGDPSDVSMDMEYLVNKPDENMFNVRKHSIVGSTPYNTDGNNVLDSIPEEISMDDNEDSIAAAGGTNTVSSMALIKRPHPPSIKKTDGQPEEERSEGRISYQTYHDYFKAGGGSLYTLGMFVIFILAEVSIVGSDIWLAEWANDGGCINSTENMTMISTDLRIGVYGALVCIVWILNIARTVLFYIILLRAATLLHNKMFISVLKSPVLFFDTNPVGRVLNRFSKDIGFMDDILIYFFCEFLQLFTHFIAVVITASIAVYYLIIFVVIMVISMVAFRWYFLKTVREIKRLESLGRSPLYSHISMTLQGLPTIRAYGKQNDLLKTFYEYQNKHSQSWYLYLATVRWFGFRVDAVCTAFIIILCFISIPLADVLNPALVGLALVYIFGLSGTFQYCIRESAEVESLMVSVERVLGYGKLRCEEEGSVTDLPTGWPDKGHIKITDLCYKHSNDGPLVLNNINCTIQSGQKVGIVGRTGAGKSSLIGAFFRLAQTNGSIKIDGVECLDIQLQDLRPRISIIPQDPVLFSGSIRHNLDPFNEYDDENIWTSLKQVQLGSVVESLDGGLEGEVTEGGNNFSVGERQLFCLARALLRHNKILMLDEATANVDLNTDSIIQQVIRQHFNECTVLTIAHRLDTVMDSDRIMVLRNGELLEYGVPYDLLCNPESYLLKLVEQTGPVAAKKLKQIAFDAAHTKN